MTNRTLTSIEIPQADSLENVRRVVEAIASGASSRKEIADKTDISVRHIDYAIHAAKSLGFLAVTDALSMTGSGTALAATGRGSAEEREQFRAAIKANEVIGMLAADLLDDGAPSKATLTGRIQQACPDLSEATAARRAQTLLAWRSQALSAQISSPEEPAEKEADAAPEPVEEKAPAPKKAAPAKKPAAKKAAKKPAAKKAAKKPAAKKPAAKKAAKKPAAKKAAKKPAAKKAAKPAAKKPAKKPTKPAAGAVEKAPEATSAAAEAPAREVTYEMDPGAGGGEG
jgi:outer membrane biosynthesis protein TonB